MIIDTKLIRENSDFIIDGKHVWNYINTINIDQEESKIKINIILRNLEKIIIKNKYYTPNLEENLDNFNSLILEL